MNFRDTLIHRRRLSLIISLMGLFGAIFFVKLTYLQVFMHSHYVKQATTSQTRAYEVPATRGQIYDLDGNTPAPLALNQTLGVVWVDPTHLQDIMQTAQALAAILGGQANDYAAKINHANRYVELGTRVSADQQARVKALRLSGVGITPRDYRTYPEGSLASQVLGFVNADGTGQYGVESYLNATLAGTPGEFAAKTDTSGIPVATASNIAKQPVEGMSYVLTIDRNIQAEVEKELAAQVQNVKAKSGSVVIMDPNTGAIKAMANFPTYDPNAYQSVTDYSVFSNNTVASEFEPGSTMKVLTYATGLDQGKITPDLTYDDPGFYVVDGHRVSNAAGDVAGPHRTMTYALKLSLNTGAMFVLRTLGGAIDHINLAGKRTLYDYFTNRFGLGVLTGIEQAGEVSGSINKPTDSSGNDVNYANMTFGQGMSVTMIQMVSAMGVIANGGKQYQPTLIAGTLNLDGTINKLAPKLIKSGVISTKTQSLLNPMLEEVVNHGTGYRAALDNAGYALAGKTGSAQIPKPDGTGYIEGANIGSFLGYAPAAAPKFVMMVRLDQPQGAQFAETTTVPLFSSLSSWLFKYDAIPPAGP